MNEYGYLDASAVVKLLRAEPETSALEHDLASRAGVFASRIALAESARAVRRSLDCRMLQSLEDIACALVIVEVTPAVAALAGALDPPGLRTLDALHLASALAIDHPGLDFIVYDERLAAAARTAGLHVVQPGR